jgi:hypothetical protein
MPRWAKVVIWAVVFAACAAAGAWVASRTDPFPPGVEDPGARPVATDATDAPTAEPEVLWVGQFTAKTEHRLRVGGSCASDWRGKYRMRLDPDGSVEEGSGIAILEPGSDRCDFEQVQTQARSVELAVEGTWERRGQRLWLSLRFREGGVDPPGSLDLGGLLATIEIVRPVIGPVFDAPFDELGDRRAVRVTDGNRGAYLATFDFLATCRSGCS